MLMLALAWLPLHAVAKGFVLVIDPGHGGKDPGALGITTNEKTITLAVAKKFGKLVDDAFSDVKVVYTRNSDKFIALDVRSDIANKAHGDLFVSIHMNSVDGKAKNRKSVHGASVYTLGLHRTNENLRVAMRENAAMTLETDYNRRYQGFNPNSSESYIMFELNQSRYIDQSVDFAKKIQDHLIHDANRYDKGVRQAGFWVLTGPVMPSVLVELDFICNPDVEKYAASTDGQNEMANALFRAFSEYYDNLPERQLPSAKAKASSSAKEKKESKTKTESKPSDSDLPKATKSNDAEPTAATSKDQPIGTDANDVDAPTVYRVQIFTHPKKLERSSHFFKGLYPVWAYRDGGVWKYTYGEANSAKAANKILRKIRDKFPDAFVITTKGSKRL